MKLFILLFLFIFSTKLFAFQNDLALKGGLGISHAKIQAFENSEDNFIGFGFNTQFSYRFTQVEISLSSYIYWGKIEDLKFKANNSEVNGSGGFRHVSFSPVFKYIYNYMPIKGWNLYTGIGPSWSLQTIKLKDFTSIGTAFNKDYKLTHISNGGVFIVGIEEILPFKEMHSTYFEVIYSYKRSRKVSVVDASDFTEVKTISSEESKQNIKGSFIMINAGVTFF